MNIMKLKHCALHSAFFRLCHPEPAKDLNVVEVQNDIVNRICLGGEYYPPDG